MLNSVKENNMLGIRELERRVQEIQTKFPNVSVTYDGKWRATIGSCTHECDELANLLFKLETFVSIKRVQAKKGVYEAFQVPKRCSNEGLRFIVGDITFTYEQKVLIWRDKTVANLDENSWVIVVENSQVHIVPDAIFKAFFNDYEG